MQDATSAGRPGQHELDVAAVTLGESAPEMERLSPYSNTGGANTSWKGLREAREYDFRTGIDWHSGYCWGSLKAPDKWRQTFRLLDSISLRGGVMLDPVPCEIGGLRGLMAQQRVGTGSTLTDWTFQAENGSVFLGFYDVDRVEAGDAPAFQWQFKGGYCAGKHVREITEDLLRVVAAVGVKPCDRELRMTRLDLCVDVLGLELQQVKRLTEAGAVVCRSRLWQALMDGMGREEASRTIYFGNPQKRPPLFLRVYDKRSELRAAGNEDKAKAYWQRNPEFQGIDKGPLTRFEFEIKRERLKTPALGMDDARWIPAALPDAIKYLTHDWFRLVETRSTRKERSNVLAWWRELSYGWAEAMECGIRPEDRDVVDKTPSEEPLQKLAACYVARLAAWTGGDWRNAAKRLLDFMEEDAERYKGKTQDQILKVWAASKGG